MSSSFATKAVSFDGKLQGRVPLRVASQFRRQQQKQAMQLLAVFAVVLKLSRCKAKVQ